MPICTGSHPDTPKPEMAAQSASERARGAYSTPTHKGGDIHPPCFTPGICLVELTSPAPAAANVQQYHAQSDPQCDPLLC